MLSALSFSAETGTPAFSHRRHKTLRLACATCHSSVEKSERAGFPAAAQCLVCHAKVDQSIPSQRVYKLPDFVFFSHAKHRAAKVECRTCHGDVWSSDRLKVEHPLSMKACIACHRSSRATVACTACHELSQ